MPLEFFEAGVQLAHTHPLLAQDRGKRDSGVALSSHWPNGNPATLTLVPPFSALRVSGPPDGMTKLVFMTVLGHVIYNMKVVHVLAMQLGVSGWGSVFPASRSKQIRFIIGKPEG